MDLQGHSRCQPTLTHLGIDADHRNLDQIRCRTLQRCIHSRPLGEATQVSVLAVDVRDRPHSSEKRCYLLRATSLFQNVFSELPYSSVPFEIRIDEAPRFCRLYPQAL